ncbi:MAG: MBL fold metallo-hydrolase [Methanosphaera sp.]|nr:MBL fold metallo-hydrolase [Methanosphaera sp.]
MDIVDDIIIILGKESDSNSYLIGDTLVDPGTGLHNDYLIESIEEADKSMDDIKRIVNTHCHFDHMGADKYLQDTYGYEIYMHPEDIKSVENKDVDATVASSFGMEVPDLDIKPIVENDEVDGYSVIHTPGHTAGGICLFDGTTLISGDTLFSGGNFGRTDLPTGNRTDMRKSIDKLSGYNISQLMPGHGPYAIVAVSDQIQLAQMIASRL